MSSNALGNDDNDGGWAEISKKTKRNRNKTTKSKTAIKNNPYVEVLDTTSNHLDGSATYERFMVLLVGLPGSGKSTFSETLVASMPQKFCRINQDELKTRRKCERRLEQVLSVSPCLCPIIDRCNFDGQQRSTWYRLAENAAGQGPLPMTPPSTTTSSTKITTAENATIIEGSNTERTEPESMVAPPPLQSITATSGIPIDVVVLDLPYEECLRRCETRKYHETIKSPQQAAGVLKLLRRQWSPPHHSKNAGEKSRYRSLTIVRTDRERKECLLRILKQA